MIALYRIAGEKLSGEDQAALGFDSSDFSESMELLDKTGEHAKKIDAALAEGKSLDEAIEMVGPLELGDAAEEGVIDVAQISLRAITFDDRIMGRMPVDADGGADDGPS